MDETTRTELRFIAERHFSGVRASHGLDHTLRVVGNALELARHYPDADVDLLEAAAWLHDIGRAEEKTVRESHAEISARLAETILPPLGFSAARTAQARQMIADHRFSAGREPAGLEGKLLQDADRLDALGVIGIARTFAESGTRELYDLDDPFARRRELDDRRYALDHFFTKLLRLSGTLHTPEARAQADMRTREMCDFLRLFARDLGLSDEEITSVL